MLIQVNDEPCELPEGSTVADLVRQLELLPEQVAVELNQELVPRSRHGQQALGEGDSVELVTLVGGG